MPTSPTDRVRPRCIEHPDEMVDDAGTGRGGAPDDVDPDVVLRAGVEGQPHGREPAQPGELRQAPARPADRSPRTARVFTSTTTRQRPSTATMSISPAGQRQFVARTSSRAAAGGAPRAVRRRPDGSGHRRSRRGSCRSTPQPGSTTGRAPALARSLWRMGRAGYSLWTTRRQSRTASAGERTALGQLDLGRRTPRC